MGEEVDLKKLIARLQSEIDTMDGGGAAACGTAACAGSMWTPNNILVAVALAVPVAWGVVLYFTNPKCMRKDVDEDGNAVEDPKDRDAKKLVKWIAVLTILTWAMIYLYKNYMKRT